MRRPTAPERARHQSPERGPALTGQRIADETTADADSRGLRWRNFTRFRQLEYQQSSSDLPRLSAWYFFGRSLYPLSFLMGIMLRALKWTTFDRTGAAISECHNTANRRSPR